MAYKLISLPNTAAAGGANPYGDLIDDPAGLVGTPLNKQTLHDIFVFFQRMSAMAGITLNDQPENTTNTFQFYIALLKHTNPNWTFSGVVFENSGSNLWDNAGAPYGKMHYRLTGDTANGIVELAGVVENTSGGSPGSPLIMTLPAAIRPSYKVVVSVWDSIVGMTQMEINTDGTVVPIAPSTGTGGTLIFLDGVSYKLGLDTY